MTTPAELDIIRRLVGPATFARGSAYARRGAVRAYVWTGDRSQVIGEVRGTAARPYRTSVEVGRTSSGRLSNFSSRCTCPVTYDCKHAVALLLAADHVTEATGTTGPGSPRGRVRADHDEPTWEQTLHALVTEPGEHRPGMDRDGAPTIGLQLELGAAPAQPQRRGAMAEYVPSISVRPVVPGKAGSWVRTGISWSSFDYLAYGRAASPVLDEQIRVLKELLALSRLGDRRFATGSPGQVVRLETIASRRLWDLLDEARDLGVPLVQAGRPTQPVTVHSSPADVAVDVTSTSDGLHLHLRATVDGVPVDLDSSLLLGSPGHGLAWWGSPATAPGRGHLSLAPLSVLVDDHLRSLLHDAVDVPRPDAERFVHGFGPALRRKFPVTSSDGSVELPAVSSATLVAFLEHRPGHRLDVTWTRGAGAGRRGSRRDGSPSDHAVVDAVARAVASQPELFEPTPSGERLVPSVQLEGMAAVHFLTELVPVLRQIDGVEVTEVGVSPEYHEAGSAPVVHVGGSPSDQGDWFDLAVSITVDGEHVPFADLFIALAEERPHLLLPSGTYFSLDREELRHLAQLIAEARTLREVPGDGVPVSRYQASVWDELRSLGILSSQAEAWSASARALMDATDRGDHPVPETLHATLRPYQRAGFNWLAHLHEHDLGGILADDMGLGKTLQALALLCHIRAQGVAKPSLVVAPTSVVPNWAAECRRFAPDLHPVVVTGTMTRRGVPLTELAQGSAVVITSYSLFRLEYEDYAAVPWAVAFFDEAQLAKNRSSQAYRRATMLPVPCKVAMTGTPMENNLMELWSLLSIVAPGLFPDPDGFARHYRLPIEREDDAERLAQLRRRVRPLMLRRTKEQVAADLPDKQEQVLEIALSPRHKRVYQTYLQRERQKVLGLLGDLKKHRFEIFRSLTLLRQASLDVSLVDDEHGPVPSSKLDVLMEMLGDVIDDGHRVLVFSQFTRFLALARRRLDAAGIECCYLDGRTRDRATVIDDFRDGKAPVFLISLKAGGFGLNLTEADYCILLDPWWNPATEAQAVDRAHRIGQTRKVVVYRLVAKDTIEEKVMALKAKKAALFANVMDGGGFASGTLTAEDIADLVN